MPGRDQEQPFADARSASARRSRSSCGRKSLARTIGPATRCGKKVRKKRELEEVARRLELAAIDIDRVAQRLERIEGDTDRQQHVQLRSCTCTPNSESVSAVAEAKKL